MPERPPPGQPLTRPATQHRPDEARAHGDASSRNVRTADVLCARARGGDIAALAQLISLTESDPEAASAAVWESDTAAHVLGITGPPGAGKSTLTSALIGGLRAAGKTVAVLAVDPSSPYSGGAILGDRIRMNAHVLDDGVFVRSFASRGKGGGLSAAAPLAIRALESVEFDYVLVETVGVGQIELDIAKYADTVLVVLTPTSGDSIQANKSGILEIADVLVVNKADLPGASRLVADLRTAQSMALLTTGNRNAVPVVETVASSGAGLSELLGVVAAHRALLDDDHGRLLRERRESAVRAHVGAVVVAELDVVARRLKTSPGFDLAVDAVRSGRQDPWSAARELMSRGMPTVLETGRDA